MASSQEPEKLHYQTISAIFNSKGPRHPPGICDIHARPPVDIQLAHIGTIQLFRHFLALSWCVKLKISQSCLLFSSYSGHWSHDCKSINLTTFYNNRCAGQQCQQCPSYMMKLSAVTKFDTIRSQSNNYLANKPSVSKIYEQERWGIVRQHWRLRHSDWHRIPNPYHTDYLHQQPDQ